MKTFYAILSFVVGVAKLFKRSCWGTKTFCQMLPRLKNVFNSSKVPSALAHGIKNDYSHRRCVCVQTKIIKKTLNPTRFTCHRVIFHYWTIDYFHCYFNQMTKPLRHSSFTLSIEKDWEYKFNYSDDLLVDLIEKSKTFNYKLFLKTSFYNLV